MPICNGSVSDEFFKFLSFQVSWHRFALHKRTKRRSVADLSTECHASQCGLHILRVSQCVRIDLNRVIRIRPRRAHRTAAFGPGDTGKHGPAMSRYAEFGSFHTGNWKLSLALEDVWSIHAWVALPVKPD